MRGISCALSPGAAAVEFRQLESLRAVVRAGSFTGAARALHMTQPAISLHIKALEDALGARLLDRDGRGVRLTAAGEILLGAAEASFTALDEARRRIGEMLDPERGTLIVACGDTVALYLLPPVLLEFRKAHPLAEIVVVNHGSRQVLDLVKRREADLGIVTRPAYTEPELWFRTILEEPLVLALPPGHPLAARDEVRLEDLRGASAVLLARPAETRAIADRALRAADVTLAPALESGNLEVVKTYVAQGMGISLLPAMAVTDEDRRRMAIRALPEGGPTRRVAVVRRKDRRPGLLLTALLESIAKRVRHPDPTE
jgi:DNA-binding transcriptional LysR family regulator